MTAFRQSVEAMIPALRRYARALARDADIADDLVQDTLVRALRSERLFLGGERLDPLLERIPLVGEGKLGAVRAARFGNTPGDRAVVGDAHDQAALAAHQARGLRHHVLAKSRENRPLAMA